MGLERRTRAALRSAGVSAAAAAAEATPLHQPPSRQSSLGRSTTTTTTSSTSSSSSTATSGSARGQQQGGGKREKRTVAILLLAHDGVANPGLWERWRRSSGPTYAARVRFFVFRNARLAFPSAFADAYDLGLRLPTQWCASSTTHASIQAVQRVLEVDPQCAQIFLVSGRDVPVFPPRVLFHPRSVTTEGTRYHLRPFGSVVCQAEPHWQDELKDEDLWEEAAAGRNQFEALIREHAVCHNTFLSLSRQHARLLLRFPRECPTAYQKLLRLGDHRRFIPLTCPEEWLLGTMLRLLLNAPHNDVPALLARVRELTSEKKPAKVAAAAIMTPATVRRPGSASSTSSSSNWTDGESSVASLSEAEESEEEEEGSEDEEEEGSEDEEEEAFSPPVTRRQKQEQEQEQEQEGEQQQQAADRYAREVVNWPLTDQNRKEADDPSPLTWASWDGEEHLILYAPGDRRRWRLRDALRSAHANGHLFYRKVGPLRKEEVEVLCAELYGLVEEDDENGDEGETEYGAMEAALLARAAKRARRNHGPGGLQSPSGDEAPGGIGRRYTLRVPTRHCVPDGSGGLYCALGSGGGGKEEDGVEGDGDMAIRRERLEGLARGRR